MPFNFRISPAATQFNVAARKLNWPAAIAIGVAALFIILPLIVLIIGGLIVGTIVYVVLKIVATILSPFSALAGSSTPNESEPVDDGRRNVRVIGRD